MRNLEECRAEVFRRSEARIRARKRRGTAVLLTCVPVVLCVAIALTVGLPGMADNASAEGAAECVTLPAMGAMTADTNCSLSLSVVRVEVKGPGIDLTHTEPGKVALIAKQLDAWTFAPYGHSVETQDDTEQAQVDTDSKFSGQGGPVDDVTTQPYGEGVTVTLVASHGESKSYKLLGDRLTELETGRSCVLTQSQLLKFADLLEITVKEDGP